MHNSYPWEQAFLKNGIMLLCLMLVLGNFAIYSDERLPMFPWSKKKDESLAIIHDEAKRGVLNAQLILGMIYYRGIKGQKRDYRSAIHWFKEVIKTRDYPIALEDAFLIPFALRNLGRCHELGNGVQKKEELALDYYKEAIDKINALLPQLERKMLENNQVITQSEAFHNISEIKAILLSTQEKVAQILQQEGREGEAVGYYKKLADNKVIWGYKMYAQFLLRNQEENIRPESLNLGLFYLSEVVKYGDPDAVLLLAKCYSGYYKQIPRDEGKMFRYLWQALEFGTPEIFVKIGICYQEGIGVAKDVEKAVNCYRKAAGKEYPNAMLHLGYCYLYGIGVDVDKTEAYQWFQKAAEKGFLPAIHNLALCYRFGHGIKQDDKKAVHYFQQAANKGNARSQYELARCYEKGIGMSVDLSIAFHWYQQSAKQLFLPALQDLARCYKQGIGTDIDLLKAKAYLQKMAELGDPKVKRNLE